MNYLATGCNPTSIVGGLEVNNNQIARYINSLIDDGYARLIRKSSPPRYRITRIGLIELISQLVQTDYIHRKEYFFFIFYFIKNYKPILEQMIVDEGKQFPVALKIELETLFNLKALVEKEIASAKTELKRLDSRIRDSLHTSQFVKKRLLDGKRYEDIVVEVEERFPYELNSTKPLSELISQIPEEVQLWGASRRNQIPL